MSQNNGTQVKICDTTEPNMSHFDPLDLRPVCVKILQVDDHITDAISYDAEIYNGTNDGYSNDNLTNIDDDDPETISTSELYTSINIAQIHDPTKTMFHISDLLPNNNVNILKIKMNLNQQMDSGANKNVTNNEKIIRNFVKITPIPIFGVGNNDAA